MSSCGFCGLSSEVAMWLAYQVGVTVEEIRLYGWLLRRYYSTGWWVEHQEQTLVGLGSGLS